jgi:hypothetical protein
MTDEPRYSEAPYVRCRRCGWVHVGVARPEPAGERCFRCKGLTFEMIDRAELRRTVPPGVTFQALRWPPLIRSAGIPKDELTAADIDRPPPPKSVSTNG